MGKTFAASTGQSAGTNALPSICDSLNRSVASLASSEKIHAIVAEQSSTNAIRTDVLPRSNHARRVPAGCVFPGMPPADRSQRGSWPGRAA